MNFKTVKDTISILLGNGASSGIINNDFDNASQVSMAQTQDAYAPFTLGTNPNQNNKKRTRKEIYTKWETMLSFAPVAEGIGIHVCAALGGDPNTSELIYIVPAVRLRNKKELSKQEQAQLQRVEEISKSVQNIINRNLTKIVHDGLGFGDAYCRIWGKKGVGITDMLSDERTYPPLIQTYEQGNKTVAFHALDTKSWQQTISKFNMIQMARLKMPRILNVPQYDMTDGMYSVKLLQNDDPNLLPIFPSHVGGSFLYQLEKAYDQVILGLATMSSQQIADAVNQMFLTINMSGMPPYQREAYKRGLESLILDHEKFVKNAMAGGEAIWNTKFHVLPTFDEKQILNPVGDIKGQRATPINTEVFMINVRILMGGFGLDPSLVGWADMLAGGLGDGAAFHTSSQIMRRSMLIRQAVMSFVNDIMRIHWGYKYGENIEDELDFPWQVEFDSVQSAAATEQIQNKQNQAAALMAKAQAIAVVKDLNLSEESSARLLERDGGMDYEEALQIAKDIIATRQQEDAQNG